MPLDAIVRRGPPGHRRSWQTPLLLHHYSSHRTGRLGLVLLPLLLAGCQSFSSPLAQWRAAYDSNLFKKMTPEEMADARPGRLNKPLQRWLTPRKNTAVKASDTPSST